MDNFTFNHKHSLNDIGIYSELKSHPLFAEPKSVYDDISGCDGELDFSANNEKGRVCFRPRIIELECHFAADGESREGFMRKTSEIAAWLTTNGYKELYFENEPGIVYYATALNLFNIEHITDFSGTFPLVFKCMPFKYSIEKDTVSSNKNTLIINNDGYYCGFELSISGVISSGFSIRCGNRSLTVNMPLNQGDTLFIDTDKMSVFHNGLPALYKCDGDFFELSPGENTIELVGSFANLNIEASYRKRYL